MIQIGIDTQNKPISFDLEVLLATRLLIQANSGAGKSWLLRKLMEQLYGHVQVIAIDPEGEFATLREKFGFVLVGKGGETPADPRSAAVVAEKLLDLRASAVCDLYEMRPADRHRWVKVFLEAMINAPKKLWHPCVVIVDEAHAFCPESKAGESEASEAMIDLATRGRKRGFCAVWATQRLSKLRKDASAELLNRLVGGTFEDLDIKRAIDLLGVASEDRNAVTRELKTLDPGWFFAFGRAITKERQLFKVGTVQTTHPQLGSEKHAAEPPPAPEKIRDLLPKLADLPQLAEQKAKTIADLQQEIRSLKAQLAAKVKQADPAEIRQATAEIERRHLKELKRLEAIAQQMREGFAEIAKRVAFFAAVEVPSAEARTVNLPPIARPTSAPQRPQTSVGPSENQDVHLKPGARRMLAACAQWYPSGISEGQLAAQSSIKRSGGTFSSYKSNLVTAGFIRVEGGKYYATDAGATYLGEDRDLAPSSTREVLELWRNKLKPGALRMLDVLIEAGGDPITFTELSERAGLDPAGGTFSSYLSNLCTANLVIKPGRRVAAANREALFL